MIESDKILVAFDVIEKPAIPEIVRYFFQKSISGSVSIKFE